MSGSPVPDEERISRRCTELIVKEDREVIATDLYQKGEIDVRSRQYMCYLCHRSAGMMFPSKSA
jgi:hypothetical protein